MNGATGEGSRIAAPINNNVTINMGVSHHFFVVPQELNELGDDSRILLGGKFVK